MNWIDINKEKPSIDEWVLAVIPDKKVGGFYIPFTTQYHGDGKFRDEEVDDEKYKDYSHLISHWCKFEYPEQ